MSNTLPDVQLVANTWMDVYDITGIASTSPLIIRNKSSAVIYIQILPTMPATSSTDGWDLSSTTGERWTSITSVPTGSKVWIKGTVTGKASIQVYE